MAFFDLKAGFERQVKEYGCHYAAVNKVAQDARRKLQEVDNKCPISDAIRWAVTGKEPNIEVDETAIARSKYSKLEQYLERVLDNVNDEAVKESVMTSVRKSRYAGHLIYEYQDIEDEPRKARVRILVRMVCSLAEKSKLA